MINQNVLTMFKSHSNDPSFSILVTDIEQTKDCGQEGIIITVHQVNKPISEIEENGSIVSRKLHIMSELDVNDEDLYTTKLLGYSFDEKEIEPAKQTSGLLSRYIEILDVKLQKSINIEFSRKYKEIPKIIPNIPEEYENLYRSFSIEYTTEEIFNEETNKENVLYTGVKINFKSLKTRKTYPIIGIVIIGDQEQEEE